MKIFKIANLFIFLYVINLSITFLYKNELFATFINDVLQANDNNLWRRKKRNIAEKTKSDPPPITYTNDQVSECIENIFNSQLFAFNKIIILLESRPLNKRIEFAYVRDLYKHFYLLEANCGDIKIPESIIDISVSRIQSLVFMISSYDNILEDASKILENAKIENKFTKDILIMYINEKDITIKEKVLDLSFIKTFVSIYPSSSSETGDQYQENLVSVIFHMCKNICNEFRANRIIP